MLTGLPADIRDVERRTHTLHGVAWALAPDALATNTNWFTLDVVRGSVTVNPLGSMPGRSMSIRVMAFSNYLDDIFDVMSVYGSWIQLLHRVTRVDGSVLEVSLGYFRVNTATPNHLDGTVEITGDDAGVLLADMALQSLAEGQVLTTQSYVDAISAMARQPLDGIMHWWSDPDGFDPGPFPATTLPKARIQREGSRVEAIQYLAHAIGAEVSMPLDGSAVFRLVAPRTDSDPSDVVIRPGDLGNLAEAQSIMDRRGVVNTALMKYTTQTPQAGARTAIRQRRLISTYVEPDSQIRVGGPFGHVTLDVNSQNITTDAQAATAAAGAIEATLRAARDYTLVVSPVYGLEAGDIVRVETMEGTGQRGIVVGANIGLTALDPWTVTVRMFNSVGRLGVAPRVTFITDATEIRDNADWKDVTSPQVDLTGNSVKGWLTVNGILSKGGSHIVWKSAGFQPNDMHTGAVFTMPAEHRIRVRFTVSARVYRLYAQAFVDPNASGPVWGAKRVEVGPGQTRTVEADVVVGAGGTFAVGVGFFASSTGSGGPPSNQVVWISEVDLAVAKRRT